MSDVTPASVVASVALTGFIGWGCFALGHWIGYNERVAEPPASSAAQHSPDAGPLQEHHGLGSGIMLMNELPNALCEVTANGVDLSIGDSDGDKIESGGREAFALRPGDYRIAVYACGHDTPQWSGNVSLVNGEVEDVWASHKARPLSPATRTICGIGATVIVHNATGQWLNEITANGVHVDFDNGNVVGMRPGRYTFEAWVCGSKKPYSSAVIDLEHGDDKDITLEKRWP